jgi:hypothetical protein
MFTATGALDRQCLNRPYTTTSGSGCLDELVEDGPSGPGGDGTTLLALKGADLAGGARLSCYAKGVI